MERKNNFIYIILISAIVGICDFYLRDVLSHNSNLYNLIAFDVFIMLMSGYIGITLAPKLNIPLWISERSESKKSKRYLPSTFLGLLLIVSNTIVFSMVRDTAYELPAYFRDLTPFTAVIIATRAALTEEILFRLLSISVIIWVSRKIIKSTEDSSFFAVILSSLLFTMIHPSFLQPFIYGLLLGYIYIKNGLIPVLIIHFLADAIPFIMTTIK